MRNALLWAAFATAFVQPAAALRAEDVWDQAGGEDHLYSDNELVPGAIQVHDMEATNGDPDEDYFRLTQQSYSSYEIIVDGLTGNLANVPATAKGDALGVMLNGQLDTPSMGIGPGGSSRAVYFRNETGVTKDLEQLRVHRPWCGATCGAREQYTIRLHDTTYGVARFNNSGSQVTILIVQNTSDRPVFVKPFFFDGAGALLGAQGGNIPSHGSLVLNTSTIPGLSGQSGSILVLNDGRYGALSGKAVALEVATGFTFDTTMMPRVQ